MTILIELQEQVYQSNFTNMLRGNNTVVLGRFKGVPTGNFTQIEGPLTQFSVLETPFRITTNSPGEVHTIRAELVSNESRTNALKVRNRIIEKQFVPVNNVVTVSIALLKGENSITVSTENDSSFTSVTSSHVGTFLTTYAREIFSSTQNPLDEQTRALFSDFSSRMTEILIPFQDLYADPKSLRTLISRFVTRAYMTKNGSSDGVRDFTAALLGTTPIFVPTKTDQNHFEPDVIPLYKSQLEFGGYEAHTWIPNFEIVHWLAFLRLIDNARHFYQIEEVGESEVLVTANDFPEIHRFDFDDTSATAYSEFNFTDFRIVIEILDKMDIKFCAAGYPFDLIVTPDNPLGQRRLAFDSNIPLDSGENLDYPALDPADDGWVGLGLSGRFENYALNADPFLYALDSMFIIPSPASGLEDCVYDGFYTQQVSTFSSEINIDETPEAEGLVSSPNENLTLESFEVDTTLEDFSDASEWSFGTSFNQGSFSNSEEIAIAGSASLRYVQPAGLSFVTIEKTYDTPLDLSIAGGQIAYLTVFLGPNAMPDSVDGIPSHPGNLFQLGIALVDSSGDQQGYTFAKEDLKRGLNVLPVMLEHPTSSGTGLFQTPNAGTVDLSDIEKILIVPRSGISGTGWDDVYIGRLHILNEQASFRPARAKIELEDINDVHPASLFGSELQFTDRFGEGQTFTGDQIYNTIDGGTLGPGFPAAENVYYPGLYKVEVSQFIGTEGFNRSITGLNMQRELGRNLTETAYTALVPNPVFLLETDPTEEVFVNVFSKQFSPTGDRKVLTFSNSNPGPDLIDFTSFSGGTSGLNEPLLGGLGSSLAQQFTTGAAQTVRFLELYLYRVGDPVGSIAVSIHEHNSVTGSPGALIERAEDVLALDILDGTPDYSVFRLLSDVSLEAATDYWIVVSGDPVYVDGDFLFRSNFSEPFPADTSGASFGTTFNSPNYRWVPRFGSPVGTNTGIFNTTEDLTLTWAPGHDGIIQSRGVAIPANFADFELTLDYTAITASNNTSNPFVDPDAACFLGIAWYDQNDAFMSTTGLSHLPASDPSPVVIDLAVLSPPEGAVTWRLLFIAFDTDGSITLDNLTIRSKEAKGEDADNHVIWAKQSGGFTNPRARTKSDLVFSSPGGFWDVETGEHHYFKVIGTE